MLSAKWRPFCLGVDVLMRILPLVLCILAVTPKRQCHYRKTSNIRRTLLGNEIVDHSDIVGASPVGAAPTTSSFST